MVRHTPMKATRHLASLAVLVLCFLPACSGPTAVVPPETVLTGSATFRERIALPPDAVLEVTLLDMTRADAPARTLNRVTLSPITRVPVYFKMRYEPSQVVPGGVYALQARILVAGKPRFMSIGNTRVLTGGRPSHLDMVLQMVQPD